MVSNCLMNKINDDSELQSFLQLKLNLFLKNCFYLKVRLPQSQRFPLRYLYFAASFTIWSNAENINSPFRKIWLWKPGQMQGIYSPQTESQQLHWHRQPRGQWRIQQFPATGWLTLVLKKNKNTCSQSGVLKTLSFPNFSSRPTWALNEVFIYLEWGQEASKDVYKS